MGTDRLLGVGLYTTAEASRLAHIPARRISRWLLGYKHTNGESPPLWTPGLPRVGGNLEISFLDLMELRFVQAFLEAGVSLVTIRSALERARRVFKVERPFATRRFRTDGRRIFLDVQDQVQDARLIDLNRSQYAFRDLVAPSFKGLEFDADRVVRWRPWVERSMIVVDPRRSFGAPIIDGSGVPTRALLDAYRVAKSFRVVAADFETTERAVRNAVAFEERLTA